VNQGANQAAYVNKERYQYREAVLNFRRLAGWTVFGIALFICWRAAEVRPTAFFEPSVAASLWRFIRELFPPDLSPDFLAVVAAATAQTLAIAIIGTILSIMIALPLSVIATPTLWRRGVLRAGEKTGVATSLLAVLSRATREVLGFLRAVPDLMWGLLFVVAVGLGSFAGTLALAVSYCGILGRVYADVFEDVDSRPLEALHALGANRTQVFLYAIWPQAAPSITAYTIYSFECCVRAASVLGFIGAGGIGYEINLSMRMFEYGQVLTLIMALLGLVSVTDASSRFLRRRLHANAPAGSLAHKRLKEERSDRRRLKLFGGTGNIAIALVVIFVVAASIHMTGLSRVTLLDSGMLARIARFAGQMFPPDLSLEFLSSLLLPLIQTIGISVIGTLIGIAIGAVLSLPATSTLTLEQDDAVGKHSLFERILRRLIYYLVRFTLNLLRSIPELVWVMICILAVGLGPFAGTLAIGLHTGGVLGKLYAETLEEVPAQPIEALRASGARPMQILLWGTWPQARPTLLSYTVLRWEMNLRVSTILGLVGGGGLGQAIYTNVQLGFYQRIATLIALMYILVIMTNWLGDRLRSRRTAI
jgi:phosphonate transport system permease protein